VESAARARVPSRGPCLVAGVGKGPPLRDEAKLAGPGDGLGAL